MSAPASTIAAIATPLGKGGIGIIRVSGSQVPDIIHKLFAKLLPPRQAEWRAFTDADGNVLDRGIALYFAAPHSYTGEHVLELQAHGGPILLQLLLDRILSLGAERARPGEFTERAFLNGKLDLTQAEAVIDLIDSQTVESARAAARSLAGEFSNKIQALKQQLIQLRLHIEAALDFPEEEIDFLSDPALRQQMQDLQAMLKALQATTKTGCLLKDGIQIAIAGQPNAGKSSLLNYLAQRDAAIVTPLAGTTRDILKESIHIDGMPLHILDTAGLRETNDPIEQEGIKRAWQAVAAADRILWLIDDQYGLTTAEQNLLAQIDDQSKIDLIYNKIDQTGKTAFCRQLGERTEIALSAKTGLGVDKLLEHLKTVMGYQQSAEGLVTARQRHLDALQQVQQAVNQAATQLELAQGELAAAELQLAQQALNQITGEFSSDDLLGEIFSRFCIGK